MGVASALGAGGARTYVVDAATQELDGVDPGGAAPPAVLREAVLEAAAAAVAHARTEQRGANDSVNGVHWWVVATPAGGDRARVVAYDVTAAIVEDRRAFQEKTVHAVQNVNFALRAVVEALACDRPALADDPYMLHLKEPLDRLSALMTALRVTHDPELVRLRRADVSLDEVVERALSSLAPRARPSRITVDRPAMIVRGDGDALADAVAAMIAAGGDGASTRLVVAKREVAQRAFACVDVEHAGRAEDAAAAWDVLGGRSLDVQLRLSRARTTILASEGAVSAEQGEAGGLRLGARVPLVSGG